MSENDMVLLYDDLICDFCLAYLYIANIDWKSMDLIVLCTTIRQLSLSTWQQHVQNQNRKSFESKK